ncbi:MAG: hypothetical protein KGR98_01575 [Verrucomicrobia bacterium]|nr:hypothetical protein [Verrucomicrobiota bacterium]MDE3098553.1 hypothetical protein [Verrucomicrobiota bacterium]
MTLTEPIETGRRFNYPSEPLKIPADQIQSVIQLVAQQPSIPVPLANAMFASMWFLNVDAFRKLEEKFMQSGKYGESLSDHRAMLANLIADGEALVAVINKNGLAMTAIKFTIEDIRATLNSLHEAFQCEHGEKNSPEMVQMIEGLFDGATA